MRPIAIDDFCAVRSLANVTFSPEGTTACFTVSQAKKEKNCYDSRLYTLKDGVVRALTSGGKESSFCYLDENTVLFAGDREGEKEPSLQSRFYRIALDGGEAELAFTFPIPVSAVYPLPGGDLGSPLARPSRALRNSTRATKSLSRPTLTTRRKTRTMRSSSSSPGGGTATPTPAAHTRVFSITTRKRNLSPA